MNLNNIQQSKNLIKISFAAKVYKINKGKNTQCSYFATIRKKEVTRLNIKEKEPYIINIKDQVFTTLIKKLNSKRKNSILGFTIPFPIGKNLPLKEEISFELFKKRIINKKEDFVGHINLQKIIPQKTIRNHPIYLFDIMDRLVVWIYSKGNKPYILPKHIPINKRGYNLFEFAGAFFCEGFKARQKNKHRDRFSFSNADPEQVEWFLNATEMLFDIPKEQWTVHVLFPSLKGSKRLIDFWSKIGLFKNKITVYRNKRVSAQYGVCIINIFGSSLAETIYHLMNYLKKEALKSKENALNFFRGLSRGDIGVSKKIVSLSTENEENALFFRRICNILDISTSDPYFSKEKGFWGVRITGYDNFKKILELNVIAHTKRKNKLISMIKNARGTKPFKYLNAVLVGYNTTRKSADFLDLSIITTRSYLAKLKKAGYLATKINKENKYKELVYSLTKKGKSLFIFYKKVMANEKK